MTSNRIAIEFTADQKAALIKGIILPGPTVTVEIGPDDLGEKWAAFAAQVKFTGGSARSNLILDGNAVQDILDAWRKEEAKAEREAETIAEIEAILADLEQNPEQLRKEDGEMAVVLGPEGFGLHSPGHLKEIGRVAVRQYAHAAGVVGDRAGTWSWSSPLSDGRGRCRQIDERMSASAKADALAGVQAREAEFRALAEAKAIREAEAKAEADRKADERAAEDARKTAATRKARLEAGAIEINVCAYNDRRYGKPWGATVSLEGGKLVYDFGAATVTAEHGNAGIIQIPCKPGDVIAHGQKDLRKPHGSENTLRIMREDGSCPAVDKTEAVKHLQALAKA